MAQETAAEKAEREAQAALAKAAEEATQKEREAHQAELARIEAEREAERREFAAQLEAAAGGTAGSASTSTRTKGYELLADSMSQLIDADHPEKGFRTFVRGDKVQLTPARAAEMIEAGAVKDPDASEGTPDAPEGEQRRKATQTQAPK